MLRRNFLKLVGLVPFTGVLSTNLVESKQEEKWYAIVVSSYYKQAYTYVNARFEVEVEDWCKPEPNRCAFAGKDGKCHTARTSQFGGEIVNPIIGVFLTERYQKNV